MMRFPNFEKARELDPRNSAVLWNLAETYACVGRFEDAERVFADAFAVHPEAHLFSLGAGRDRIESERRHRTVARRVAEDSDRLRSRRFGQRPLRSKSA